MRKIIECVPNFSEGRSKEVVDLLAQTLSSPPGVALLDAEMDSAHNRCVISVAGEPEAVAAGVVAAVGKAVELIDLRRHKGEHPRMGAADVIPFIPISGLTMEEAIELSVEVARQIAGRYDIPVYLYEQSARVSERRDLAFVRKGEFEGIRDEIRTRSERKPDFGPAEVHPSAGASAVGARFPLIAYNIYLDSTDIKIAQAIAQTVRFSGGGLRFVKALGFDIKERNQVQVSMNLTDHQSTPIFRAFEVVDREARRFGVSIASSEIVGLVPQQALDACAGHYLHLENFAPGQILENRLEQSMISGPSLGDFIADLARPEIASGCGSAAALAGALAAALGEMISGPAAGGLDASGAALDARQAHLQMSAARRKLYSLIEEDAAAGKALRDVRTLPDETGTDPELRAGMIDNAARREIETSLAIAQTAFQSLECLARLLPVVSQSARPDAASGAQFAHAALKAVEYHVFANSPLLGDAVLAAASRAEVSALVERAKALIEGVDHQAAEAAG